MDKAGSCAGAGHGVGMDVGVGFDAGGVDGGTVGEGGGEVGEDFREVGEFGQVGGEFEFEARHGGSLVDRVSLAVVWANWPKRAQATSPLASSSKGEKGLRFWGGLLTWFRVMMDFVNRREFLAAAGGMAAGSALGGLTPGGRMGEDRGAMNVGTDWRTTPQYFVWSGPETEMDAAGLKAKYRGMKDQGLTGVFLSGYDAANVAAMKEVGLDCHIWMWTTNRGDAWIRENHPDWFMVSRSGKSCFDQPPYVDYYRWVSPVVPGVQSYLKDRVAEIVEKEGVDGVHLDYVRYPDVILPRALWETYGLDQTEELADYDFCYSEHTQRAFREKTGRDLMAIKDPAHDQEWLKFRFDSVTALVNQLVGVAREHKKQITAAVFPTPSMARTICRQDWDKWPLDAFTPMIYHSFYNEDVAWIGDCMREDIQATTVPIVAGLYMPAFKTPDEFAEGLRVVKKRGGAGVSLFGGVEKAYWDVFAKERW